jgi:hypothetical protein
MTSQIRNPLLYDIFSVFVASRRSRLDTMWSQEANISRNGSKEIGHELNFIRSGLSWGLAVKSRDGFEGWSLSQGGKLAEVHAAAAWGESDSCKSERRVMFTAPPPGSCVSLPQLWRIAALKNDSIASTRSWIVQRDLHQEKFRNSVLFCPLGVTAKIDEWQKLTYEPGGNCIFDGVV